MVIRKYSKSAGFINISHWIEKVAKSRKGMEAKSQLRKSCIFVLHNRSKHLQDL